MDTSRFEQIKVEGKQTEEIIARKKPRATAICQMKNDRKNAQKGTFSR